MATRWKRERTEEIFLMHAHNQWSNWKDCQLRAAEDLGLPVGRLDYPNHYDGSRDTLYYTSGPMLDRVGGMSAVNALASEYHAAMYGQK